MSDPCNNIKKVMIDLLKDENTLITSSKSFYDLKRPDDMYHIIEFTTRICDNVDE